MRRFSYQNVMATIAALALLAGGTAYAANQLAKNSVGTKQLKKNSVTAKKIKKNAVTAAKIKNGAVDSSRIADGSIGGADIDIAATSFTRLVSHLHTDNSQGFGVPIPYSIGTYSQNAGEDNFYLGSIDVRFPASCGPPRGVQAYLLMDTNPAAPQEQDVIGYLSFENEQTGEVTIRREFGGSPFFNANPPTRGAPAVATPHTFIVLLGDADCTSGSGILATGGTVDVIGAK